MRKWLHDRPWFWIVLLLGLGVGGGLLTVIIAEWNRPEIVKPRPVPSRSVQAPSGSSSGGRISSSS